MQIALSVGYHRLVEAAVPSASTLKCYFMPDFCNQLPFCTPLFAFCCASVRPVDG